jgi:hypothetical protein
MHRPKGSAAGKTAERLLSGEAMRDAVGHGSRGSGNDVRQRPLHFRSLKRVSSDSAPTSLGVTGGGKGREDEWGIGGHRPPLQRTRASPPVELAGSIESVNTEDVI